MVVIDQLLKTLTLSLLRKSDCQNNVEITGRRNCRFEQNAANVILMSFILL